MMDRPKSKLPSLKKHIRRISQSSYVPSSIPSSIDTEAVLSNSPPKFLGFSSNCQPNKLYDLKQFLPSPKALDLKPYLPQPLPFLSKENVPPKATAVQTSMSSPFKSKDSFQNPMISITSDNTKKTPRSPIHGRRNTADFNYPTSPDLSIPEMKKVKEVPVNLQLYDSKKVSLENTLHHSNKQSIGKAYWSITPKFQKDCFVQEENSFSEFESQTVRNLLICTCIYAGSLYEHFEDCREFEIPCYPEWERPRRLGLLESVLVIQRGVREYLAKKKQKIQSKKKMLKQSSVGSIHQINPPHTLETSQHINSSRDFQSFKGSGTLFRYEENSSLDFMEPMRIQKDFFKNFIESN